MKRVFRIHDIVAPTARSVVVAHMNCQATDRAVSVVAPVRSLPTNAIVPARANVNAAK